MTLLALSLAACSGASPKAPTTGSTADTTVDCETIPERVCGNAARTDEETGDTGCPEGFACWGPSAFVCYRGAECELPICLPPVAEIATPDGPRALRDLRVGDRVLSFDEDGRSIVVPVARLGSTLAPAGHEVVGVVLDDGRALRGSPGHPTADGRSLGELVAGDVLDGSEVVAAEPEPYPFARTYDLLPAGPTGAYVADGVALGSTLGR
jgi:hypothetical protein